MENTSSKKQSKAKLTTLSMAQIAVCTAILCVLSPLSIPLPVIPVPITLQVFAVVLVALVLKPLHALIAQLLYTVLGIIGLPVFAGGKSGFGTILSPTGGFLIGFIIASFVVSLLKGKGVKKTTIVRYILAALAGVVAIYIPGIVFFAIYTGQDLVTSAAAVAASFILIDVAKCVVAAALAVPINIALAKIK